MDEQFEKTENSMSIYYTVNKMLIALHMALLVFFVVMRVYVITVIFRRSYPGCPRDRPVC